MTRTRRFALCALLLLALTPPAAADEAVDRMWGWRAYPNGGAQVGFDRSPEWLLVAFPGGQPADGVDHVIAKAAPTAVVAHLSQIVPGRYRLQVLGVDAAGLRRIGRELLRAGAARAVWPAMQRSTGVGFVDDRLDARFQRPFAPADLAKLGVALEAATALPGVYRLRALDGDAIGAAWRLSRVPGVAWAEPDLIRHVVALDLPNDPQLDSQWHLNNDDDRGDINAPEAWALTTGDPGTVIGVFDTGFDLDHPDLLPNIVGGFDAASNDDDPESGCGRQPDGLGPAPSCPANSPYRESHGTAVAGVSAASGANDLFGAGVCPDCSLYLVRIIAEGDGFRSISSADAFQRAADAGVAVINNSWGPGLTRFFPLSVAEQETFERITTESRDGRGVVLVFAAGNDYFTPANANPYAAHPGVITVSASTRKDDFACYSNYGDVIAVAAPSQGCFDGEPGIATTDYQGREGYSPNDFTTGFGGTSAASPVVAGLAGLVLSANPELTAQQVRLVLQTTARKIRADQNNWQAQVGFDLAAEFEYDESGFSKGFGYGRIDAAAAVARALNMVDAVAGVCDDACARCVDDRCAPDCAVDADCPAASRCLPAPDGGTACILPRLPPTAPGQPCGPDCERCVTTVDSQMEGVDICTVSCEDDEGCPFGFDCRSLEADAPKACVPGNAECGAVWGDVRCQSGVRVTSGGVDFCSCDCVPGVPGACPDSMECSWVECEQARGGLLCEAVNGQFGANYPPQCIPDPDFRPNCEEHRECGGGLFCIEGECRVDTSRNGCDICAPCNRDADCANGEVCADLVRGRRCVAPCELRGDDCPGDSECTNLPGVDGDFCVNPSWRSKGYCPRAYRCEVEGRCFTDTDCADGVACEEHVCADAIAPVPDAAPEPDAAPPPDAAVPDAEPIESPPDAALPDAEPPAPDAGRDSERQSARDEGCQSVGANGTPLLGLAVLFGLIRRRRRL